MNKGIRTPEYIIELARDMRRNMTETERILWYRLNKRQCGGHKFRAQHPLYRYVLDFYCHEKKLAVEIDGALHEAQSEYDQYRDEFLGSIGIRTLRIKSDELLHDIESVVQKILIELESIP